MRELIADDHPIVRKGLRNYPGYFLFIHNEEAEEPHISPSTISTYRDRIMDKLGMSRNSELIRYSLNNKFIE